ncbi:unnamed protein product, partial [Musa hybrid cultivar]
MVEAFSDEETHCLVVIQYLLCDELKLSVNNSSTLAPCSTYRIGFRWTNIKVWRNRNH